MSAIDRALKASMNARRAAAKGGVQYEARPADPVAPPLDTPELRGRLKTLGQKKYNTGEESLTPSEMQQFDELSKHYNFPRYVGDYGTREDEDAAQADWLQGHAGDSITEAPKGFAEGGSVNLTGAQKSMIQTALALIARALHLSPIRGNHPR